MLSFKQFLTEKVKLGTNIRSEKTGEHVKKYIEPFVGSETETHELAKDSEHLPAGEKVKIHSTHSDLNTGRLTVRVSGKDGKEIEIPSSSLYKPKETVSDKKEKAQLQNLNDQISAAKGDKKTIKVKVGNKILDVASAENVKGTPKSDFALTDENGDHIHHISHKDGSGVRDFQQLAGVSHSSISNHPFVKGFIDKLKKRHPGGVPKGEGTFASRNVDQENPEERKLALQSTFGTDHGKEYGINNVHSLMQGNLSLRKIKHPVHGDIHELVSSGETVHNENNPEQRLPFESKIYAMHRADRNNQGLNKTRIYVAPEGSRPVREHLN